MLEFHAFPFEFLKWSVILESVKNVIRSCFKIIWQIFKNSGYVVFDFSTHDMATVKIKSNVHFILSKKNFFDIFLKMIWIFYNMY